MNDLVPLRKMGPWFCGTTVRVADFITTEAGGDPVVFRRLLSFEFPKTSTNYPMLIRPYLSPHLREMRNPAFLP